MKISSYNISDVGFHYIGLRVLANGGMRREEQLQAIARGVFKYVSDRALRLMLPEPKSNFATVGEKVCQELAHFEFATSEKGVYVLTDTGRDTLKLLNDRKFQELRRRMIAVHLATYDNLRAIVERHLEIGSLWRGIVEGEQMSAPDYVERLLKPTFKEVAEEAAKSLSAIKWTSAKKLEDTVNELIINRIFSDKYSVPLFRSLCDRLISLRLLNIMKASLYGCEFAKSYSPTIAADPHHPWHHPLQIRTSAFSYYTIYLSEPDMADSATLEVLQKSIEAAFSELSAEAGYFDLPEIRDYVCERLKIPEAAFDEGVNALLDRTPSALSVGLRYEGISGRRKPLVRSRETTQIHNLIRRS